VSADFDFVRNAGKAVTKLIGKINRQIERSEMSFVKLYKLKLERLEIESTGAFVVAASLSEMMNVCGVRINTNLIRFRIDYPETK
jgi:hypothetical protein